MTVDEWVEGETGPRTYALENIDELTGVISPENLTGKNVELILRKQDGTLVPTTGDVVVSSAPDGEVTFTPDSTDLTVSKSPLFARFKVTLGDASKFFPKGEADLWKIYRP